MVTITTFTDPMMGLSYECEPVFRKLETHFAGQVSFDYRMGLLVDDVYRLVDPNDMREGAAVAIDRYLKRLARIYEHEESIAGMPINMSNLQLFAPDRTSTMPLCKAYHAARMVDNAKAAQFLYNLRYATIVECRPTTKEEEIERVVVGTGIDLSGFRQYYHDGSAEKLVEIDLRLMRKLGIHALPTCLITYNGRSVLASQLIGYDCFVRIIDEISHGDIRPQKVEGSLETARQLLIHHPLISPIEISEALDLSSLNDVEQLISPLLQSGNVEKVSVYHGFFFRMKRGRETT